MCRLWSSLDSRQWTKRVVSPLVNVHYNVDGAVQGLVVLAGTNEAGGADVDIGCAVDEPGGNANKCNDG